MSIKTLTHSPVAAGEVIAFEKDFGIVIQSAARRGIIIMLVSLLGTHPMQYLLTAFFQKLKQFHDFAVAFVIHTNSLFTLL
jgi:hypothetical protein